jgi:hypothetical protein
MGATLVLTVVPRTIARRTRGSVAPRIDIQGQWHVVA